MPLREVEYLLVGGGLASATAAETLRAEGATGSIVILSAEDIAPYQRPPLSKEYLQGSGSQARLFIHPDDFYRDQAIELRLNTPAIAADPERQTVTAAHREVFKYKHLLLATGMRPKRLSVPGATLAEVHSLRNKADCDAIRLAALQARRAVVLGASFLGMEIALSLKALGIEVTVVERSETILPWLAAPDVGEFFRHQAEGSGVSVLLRDTAAAFTGEGRVEAVETKAGRHLPCDLVIVSIGVRPVTEFLAGSGIACDGGLVIVDDQLRTSVADVFAAGDITSFYDPVFARRRHIEHWDNAIKQGRLAARNMLGRRLRYDEVSYFFCDLGDCSFAMLGGTHDVTERIGRGSLDARSFALFYLHHSVARALFSLGRPADETRVTEGLIRYRVNLAGVRDRLPDPGFALDRIALQTVLVLQGGGALGAFECGVVKALEENQIFPDVVAGVSIGALNGAIIAANPRHATAALEAFWSDLAVATPGLPGAEAGRAAALMRIMMFGVPNFFTPRWLSPFSGLLDLPLGWTSYYDMSPMRQLIAKYVDFSTLKSSPVRLLVGAVEVATAKLEIFDGYVDDLTPDHILASSSLPPLFPWTVVNGKAYWDGGIVSNSPLQFAIDRCGADGKRVFIVDLFAGQRPLPANMAEVLARYEEVVYSERIQSDLRLRETVGAYHRLVEGIMAEIGPAGATRIKQRPDFIQLISHNVPTTITRFVRDDPSGEPAWRDYDFSDASIERKQADGYALAKRTLGGA